MPPESQPVTTVPVAGRYITAELPQLPENFHLDTQNPEALRLREPRLEDLRLEVTHVEDPRFEGPRFEVPIPNPSRTLPRSMIWVGLAAGLLLVICAGIFMIVGGGTVIQDWISGAAAPGNDEGAPVAEVETPDTREEPTKAPPSPLPSATDVPGLTSTPTHSLPAPATPTTPARASTPISAKRYSGWVVYAAGEDNEREIFAMNPATGETKPLTQNSSPEEWPSLSPDNRYLAYSAYRAEGWQIYVTDLENGKEKQITHFQDQARCPQWSPVSGSSRLLFEGRTGVTGSLLTNIWVVDADGSNLKQITFSNTDLRARWAPDGSKFVVGRAFEDSNGDGRIHTSDNMDMVVVDLVSGAESRITNTPENDDFQFAWSPNGETLAFVSVRGDLDGNGVRNLDDAQGMYLMPSRGGPERYLEMNGLHVFSPDYSADGTKIVFIADIGSQNEIWLYDLDGGELKRFSRAGSYYHTAWAH